MTLSVTGLSAVRSGRMILFPTSVDIPPRARIGLVGSSGSGKSTLGHALIDDLRKQGHSVAHVPQSPDEALDPLRSMAFHWREAEVALGLAPGSADQETLFHALDIAGGDLRKRPWGWSRCRLLRFAISMALSGQPVLIVFDDPTSALDPVVAAATMDLLNTFLTEQETAMILITHDLGLAAQHVESLLLLDQGRLVEEGPTQQVLEAPQTQAAKDLAAHRNWMSLPC